MADLKLNKHEEAFLVENDLHFDMGNISEEDMERLVDEMAYIINAESADIETAEDIITKVTTHPEW